MEETEIVVIGAGVVGIAIARALASMNRSVVVFEQHRSFGQETSSRNSEVIHAGIYYPAESLKSKLCISGNRLLYQLCRENGIRHHKCGKVIIAVNDQESSMVEEIFQKAVKIGVPELKLLTKSEIERLEPAACGLNGVFSGSTGIIDSHNLMEYLLTDAETQGAMFVFNSRVTCIEKIPDGYRILTSNGDEIAASIVINSAGLFSDQISSLVGIDSAKFGYKLHYCKGDYFGVSGSRNMLEHLIYPVPHEKGYGLGIHATLNLDGYVRLGPDATYVDKLDYDIDSTKRDSFFEAAVRYLPQLKKEMLGTDTSGIRPKLQGPNDGVKDFVIKEESDSGYPGFVNLIGIESPGLTSCLSIADHVGSLLAL